jgi:hypothetical protein
VEQLLADRVLTVVGHNFNRLEGVGRRGLLLYLVCDTVHGQDSAKRHLDVVLTARIGAFVIGELFLVPRGRARRVWLVVLLHVVLCTELERLLLFLLAGLGLLGARLEAGVLHV